MLNDAEILALMLQLYMLKFSIFKHIKIMGKAELLMFPSQLCETSLIFSWETSI